MGQYITLPEFVAIVVICLPILILVKTIIDSIKPKK